MAETPRGQQGPGRPPLRAPASGWECALSACTIVAVYAGLLSVTMQAFTEYQSGLLMIGVAVPPKAINLLQAAVPLAVGLLFLWRTSARRRGAELPCTPATALSQVAAQ